MMGARRLLVLLLAAWSGGASAYVLMGMKWPEAATTFYPGLVHLGSEYSPSGIRWQDAFAEAADEWSRKTAFRFVVDAADPSHPCAGIMGKYPEDGFRNGAAFTASICTLDRWGNPQITGFGAATLGVTMNYTEAEDGRIISESDIFFNTGEDWDIYDGPERPRSPDFRRVALHELGHALGLDHERREAAIMQPYMGDLYHLQEDDIRGVAALYGASLPAGMEPIVMRIEAPEPGSVQSGIGTFRGWVVSFHELVSLSIYLDGRYRGELDHNGLRRDVGSAYPEYSDPDHSGFAFAFSYGGLSAGAHRYRVVAQDELGNQLEETVKFEVVRFATPWLDDSSRVSVDGARLGGSGNEIHIENLLHDGRRYRLILRWDRASQKFQPVEITELAP